MTVTGVPLAPGCRPVVGHAVRFLREPLSFLESLPAVGDLVEVRLGPMRMYLACDPELTWQVLTNDRVFDKGGALYEQIREVAGNGLITCPHGDHRRQRRLAQPAFQAKRIDAYGALMEVQVQRMVESWHDGQVIDVPAELVALTSNTVVETVFSSSLGQQSYDEVADDLNQIINSILRRAVSPALLNRLPTRANRGFARACRRLRELMATVIDERRRSARDPDDLLSALMQARDEESSGAENRFADDEIADQFVTFLVGGSETTANVLSWSLYLLASHPEVQAQVRAEVDEVLAGRSPTMEDVPRLGLIGRLLTEALRMYPTGSLFFTREVTRPVRLGEYDLPAGATVAYSAYLIHHRPDLYPDPHRFDLNRTYPRRGFVSFAAGARKCIGDSYAMTEATLALAAILSRFHFETLPGEEGEHTPAISLRPRKLHMRLTARMSPLAPVVPIGRFRRDPTMGSASAAGRPHVGQGEQL